MPDSLYTHMYVVYILYIYIYISVLRLSACVAALRLRTVSEIGPKLITEVLQML